MRRRAGNSKYSVFEYEAMSRCQRGNLEWVRSMKSGIGETRREVIDVRERRIDAKFPSEQSKESRVINLVIVRQANRLT